MEPAGDPLNDRMSGDVERGVDQPPPRHQRDPSGGTLADDSGDEWAGTKANDQQSTHSSGHAHVDEPQRPKLPLKTRMKHFTWAWFTLPMSTGGLSLLIFAQPHQFPGLREIGFAVYILHLVIFTLACLALTARFLVFPGTFKGSITHPREGFFVPTFFLSIATIITSTQRYALPDGEEGPLWLVKLAFWSYLAVTGLLAIGQYSMVFSMHSFGLQTMMPTWILPIFPVMLTGTIASVIAGPQPDLRAVEITVAGLTAQGLGLSVAFLMYAHMIGRLMSASLPDREHRPGLFMCVGPPAFTALAFIGMAQALPAGLDHDRDGIVDIGQIRTVAVLGGGLGWALSLWWFGIALVAVLSSPPRYFHLGWWAMVFPNTGFILATISLGNAFGSKGVLWTAAGMSLVLLATYCYVLYHHVRAFIVQDIMYPGRDEDVGDH